MTKSEGTICLSVPLFQILGGTCPPSPVIYAHGCHYSTKHSIEETAVTDCISVLREYFLLFTVNARLISTADVVVCCNL